MVELSRVLEVALSVARVAVLAVNSGLDLLLELAEDRRTLPLPPLVQATGKDVVHARLARSDNWSVGLEAVVDTCVVRRGNPVCSRSVS